MYALSAVLTLTTLYYLSRVKATEKNVNVKCVSVHNLKTGEVVLHPAMEFEESRDDLVTVIYEDEGTIYKYISKNKELPPLLEKLDETIKDAYLKEKSGSAINVLNLIREYAGPGHDFYGDTINMKEILKDIFSIKVCSESKLNEMKLVLVTEEGENIINVETNQWEKGEISEIELKEWDEV
jgi:hypothetical protein